MDEFLLSDKKIYLVVVVGGAEKWKDPENRMDRPFETPRFSSGDRQVFLKSGKGARPKTAVEKKKLNCERAVNLTGFERPPAWKAWKRKEDRLANGLFSWGKAGSLTLRASKVRRSWHRSFGAA